MKEKTTQRLQLEIKRLKRENQRFEEKKLTLEKEVKKLGIDNDSLRTQLTKAKNSYLHGV